MSNPLVHTERSARHWGGTAAEFLPLHQWLDSTRGHMGDVRHRMVLHNAFGVLLAEQVFGPEIPLSNGRRAFVRDVAARHIVEDLGFIPSLSECLSALPIAPWMAGARTLVNESVPSLLETTSDDRPLCQTS